MKRNNQTARFYVYIHRRETDGSIFYVGKGNGNRAWTKSSRSKWWKRISEKNGFLVEICQDGMYEDDAFLLESWIIAKFRHEGISLCNLTDGGDGVSGFDHPSKKPIYCSNGMHFISLSNAVMWLRNNVNSKAMAGCLSTCARGVSNSAYGFRWSYDGYPDEPEFHGKSAISASTKATHSKTVYCSNGMAFNSSREAAEWVSSDAGKECSASSISSACTGETMTAHGYSWSRSSVPEAPMLTGRDAISASISKSNALRRKRVYCSNGMEFECASDAIEWVKLNGYPNGNSSNISACATGKVKSAFGYSWSYAN